MKNTKDLIKDTALRMFNEKGYKNVSLRDIAKEAGTTIGNMTYHYPKKGDLVLAVQSVSHDLFDFEELDKIDSPALLKNILSSFTDIMERRKTNYFMYKNIIELSQESPEFYENIERFRNSIYDYYCRCFLKLKADGLMRNDISDEQYRTLSYILTTIQHIWIQECTQYYSTHIPHPDMDKASADLLYPYLTEEGITIAGSM